MSLTTPVNVQVTLQRRSSSPRPKRVYWRDWKLQTRSVRGSVSLPRLHLITPTRPFFECPRCSSFNDRLPICLWCKSTNQENAAAFWASMPKQRTVSAPMKITWRYVPASPMASVPGRAKSAETVSRPRSRTTQGAPSTPSVSSHNSSHVNKSNTLDTSSTRTSTTTPAEIKTNPMSPAVDEIGHTSVDCDQPGEGKFHTLPLRRKGHILRTTAGMVVNKSRLSALFRKDAVPVLDKVVPVPSALPAKTKRKTKPRSMNAKHEEPREVRQKRSALIVVPSLPTIPDASPPSPPSNAPSTYMTPTPPSFLSPFWYRPEEYDRLPASPPGSRATSVKTPGPYIARPTHAHTRSEPFPTLEHMPSMTRETPPKAWKRRMSGFFRHSISVMAGHKAPH